MSDLAFLTICELREKLDKKEISPKELTQLFLQNFVKQDKKVDSALEIYDLVNETCFDNLNASNFMPDTCVNRICFNNSSVSDCMPDTLVNGICSSNFKKSLLYAIPGVIKDNICQESKIASCGSKILENFVSPYDATAVKRLKDCGATILARVNCDEFAMGSSTETSAYKKTRNPWDLSCVPGGSSGGSAAAVAAGLVPWALGSDTGGSVRQPAAYCGLVGIKPTYGLVSRYGLIAYASSFDQIGVITRTVKDNAIVFSQIAGQDSKDSTTLQVKAKDYTVNLTGKIKTGLKIGIIEDAINSKALDCEVAQAVEGAIKKFESMGASIKRVSMKTLDYAAAAYMIISRAEAASNLARFDGAKYGFRYSKVSPESKIEDAVKIEDSAKLENFAKTENYARESNRLLSLTEMYCNTRHDGFGAEVRSRIMVGNYVLSAGYADKFYDSAKKVQGQIRVEFKDLFEDIDLLIMPTHSAPAFKIGAFDFDKLQMELQDFYTVPVNLAGVPAISIPCGFTKGGMPIGFQIIGPHLSEELIFQTAYAYEQQMGWYLRRPNGF